jgi:CTP:molybdopterin cytidylyltransferase MocA
MKGHPVLMRCGPYREEIELLGGDKGLREVIEKHSKDVLFIEGDEGILFDIDTEEDLEVLRRRGYRIEKGEF